MPARKSSSKKRAGKPRPERRGLFAEFKNIRTLPSGYQVAVTRSKKEFSRHFAGLTDESLQRAMRYRDQLLKKLPPKRNNPVPRHVLAAAGLTKPLVGVYRHVGRRFYQVSYRDEKGTQRGMTFSWRTREEEIEAYRTAVELRRGMLGLES
jgi:hypothetical protein